MVGREPRWFEGAAARAIERAILRNELHGSRAGLRGLRRWVLDAARNMEREGLNATDLRDLAYQLACHIKDPT